MSWEYFDNLRHEKYRPASIGEVSKCKHCDKDYPSSENAEQTYEENKPRCGRKHCPVKPDGSGFCIVAENLKENTYMRSCNLQYLMNYCPDCQHESLIPCKAFNCENFVFKLLSRLSGPETETCPICVEYQPVKGYFGYYNEFCVTCSGNLHNDYGETYSEQRVRLMGPNFKHSRVGICKMKNIPMPSYLGLSMFKD